MKTFYLPLNLQLFAEEPGVEEVPAAEEQTEVTPDESGVEQEVVAEPVKDEKDFAKALKAREEQLRQQIESEYGEKYKHYDDYRKVSEYFQRTNGAEDVLTLKEQIELAELTEQAEQQQVPVEVMKRLQELESKAERADQLEKQQQEQQTFQAFQSELEKFAKENEADAKALADYMYENQVGNFSVALKAMKAEEYQKQLETAKETAVKEYLESKKAPIAEGSGSAGVQTSTPKTWEESRQAALERLRAARTPQ